MSDPYQRLAKHLDQLPGGFPPTESGLEIRILKRLFTPEEAELAAQLTLAPETATQIAQRLGEDRDALAKRLDEMASKGLIFRSSKGEEPSYMAAQFVVGIWEYQVNNLDEDLIRDVNEYQPYLMKRSWEEPRTKQLRVVPVSESLEPDASVMPYDQAEAILEQQSKIAVAPCICRKEHAIMGHGCGRSQETCLIFGGGAYFYEEIGLGRSISVDEAKQILRKGLEENLVLQPGNSQKPANICLCCGCCCQILKNLKALHSPAEVVHSNFYAEVDPESCTACGACEDACQMDAVEVRDEVANVDTSRCIGCGLCINACDFEAIQLRQKESEELYEPPTNVGETFMNIARERGLM